MGYLLEALKGGKIQVDSSPGYLGKVQSTFSITKIIGNALLNTVQNIPYGIRALMLHRNLPNRLVPKNSAVYLEKNIKYGSKPRCFMDIYSCGSASQRGDNAVALFCHGGVWASGDPWNYAPLAANLAASGIVTCVMTHTLYPNALAPEMADEVAIALDWVYDNIENHGGCPEKVSLVGHSSGAHLCMLSLMNKARDICKGEKCRMPKQLVGISGAYDIAEQYKYEVKRGVAYLSTLERAMGGGENFCKLSPTILSDLAHRKGNAPDVEHTKRSMKLLPSVVLMASDSDVVVPSCQSTNFIASLKRLGVTTDLKHHDGVGHVDYVIDWPTNIPDTGIHEFCKDFQKDVVKVLNFH